MEGELRDQVERLLLRMKLVTREEFEVVEALAQKARAEQEILTERLAALEARLASQVPASSPPVAKPKAVRRQRGEA